MTKKTTVEHSYAALDSTTFQRYLQQVQKIKLLTKEQEAHYAYQAQLGDTASRDKMLMSNLRLVISIAKRYTRAQLSMAELTAEGNLGLIHALSKFDSTLGYRFSTYASWWIQNYIDNYVLHQKNSVRVSLATAKELKKAKAFLLKQRHFGTPSPAIIAQLAEYLARSPSYVEQLLNTHTDTISLHEAPEDAQYLALEHSLIYPADETPCSKVEEMDFLNFMQRLIEQLPKRERYIIQQRFQNATPPTREQLGAELGLTRERIRQIELHTLNQLKLSLIEHGITSKDFNRLFNS